MRESLNREAGSVIGVLL